MRRLIAFLIRQRVFFNIAFIGTMLYAALVAIPGLPVDRYPNFPLGEAEIQVEWPGASAEDVENQVTRIIENAIREDMSDIEFVRSTSRQGQAYINVKFIDDSDYPTLFDDLRARVMASQNRLPSVNGDPIVPSVTEVETDTWLPVVIVSLIDAEGGPVVDNRARSLLATELRARIEIIPGVRKVIILGEQQQQMMVSLDPSRLEAAGITYADVAGALANGGLALPAGRVTTPMGQRTVRVDARYRDRNDLTEVVVRRDGDGNFITVGDLIDPAATGIRRVPGTLLTSSRTSDAINLYVIKDISANAATVKQGTVDTVEVFLGDHAESGIDATYNLDSTIKINDSIGVLQWSLVQGVVLVGIALLFFLTRRSAILASGGILFSFIGTLVLFHLFGYSLNTITLLGFVLTVGIIVDDAIVVIENIQRHREEGKTLKQAAIDGTAEVILPVIAATLTTIGSFMPLLLMTGTTGDFFSLIPIAVTCALAISLIECLILLPIHALDFETLLGPERIKLRREGPDEWLQQTGVMGRISRLYDRLLHWHLAHPWRAVGIATLLFLLAIGVMVQSLNANAWGMKPLLREKFFPEDSSVFQASVIMPAGTPLEASDSVVRELQGVLLEQGPGQFRTTTGIAGFYIDDTYKPVWGNQHATAFAELPAVSERDFDDPYAHLEATRQLVNEHFADRNLTIEIIPQKDSPPTGPPITVRVGGINETSVLALADDLLAWMRDQQYAALSGAIDLRHDREQFDTVLDFRPDLRALAEYGLTPEIAQQFIAGAIDGSYIGDFRRQDGDIPTRVRLSPSATASPEALAGLPVIFTPEGAAVRFADIGRMSTAIEPSNLVRRDFQRTVTITGNLAEDTTLTAGDVIREVQTWYDSNNLTYPGASIAFGGEAESTGKSYASLLIAFGVSMCLIYLILATQFRSYLQPLLIMSNVIFSFTGVLLVMGLIGAVLMIAPEGLVRPERAMLTVQTFIAIIALTGLVVNDAIVLIDFINQRRREGLPLRLAIITASHQRMRPIMLTTITTIFGLLAMAIGIPRFAIEWSPMATCFIAGLSLSTVMTLLLVPMLYERLALFTDWMTPKRLKLIPSSDESTAPGQAATRSTGDGNSASESDGDWEPISS